MGSHSVGMLGTSPSWTPVTQHPKDYLNSSLSILAFILWQVASQLFFFSGLVYTFLEPTGGFEHITYFLPVLSCFNIRGCIVAWVKQPIFDQLVGTWGDSVDGVVVGVRRGKGRRSGVYGSFLLAVRSLLVALWRWRLILQVVSARIEIVLILSWSMFGKVESPLISRPFEMRFRNGFLDVLFEQRRITSWITKPAYIYTQVRTTLMPCGIIGFIGARVQSLIIRQYEASSVWSQSLASDASVTQDWKEKQIPDPLCRRKRPDGSGGSPQMGGKRGEPKKSLQNTIRVRFEIFHLPLVNILAARS